MEQEFASREDVFHVIVERRHSRVVRAAWLWCRKSPEGGGLEAGLRHPTIRKLSLSTQQ